MPFEFLAEAVPVDLVGRPWVTRGRGAAVLVVELPVADEAQVAAGSDELLVDAV